MAASSFSFPTLNRKELVKYLSDLEIAGITEEHLTKLTPSFVADLYTTLLIYLDPLQDDNGQADFHALGRLDNPDLHVDSVRTMNLCKKIKDLVAAVSCSTNFTLKDLVKPDINRTAVFLSAILNFCLFRANKLNALQEYVDQIDVQEEKQKELRERIAQLNNEISEIKYANEMEQPYVLEVDAKVKELRQTIQGLNNHQVSLKGSFRTLRDKAKEIDEKITTADFTLAQSAQENAKLRSKIVQSPEKLQGAIEEKKQTRDEIKNSERSAMQSFQDKSTTLELYSKACEKMSKHLAQMQAIQEQVTSAKTVDKEIKVLKAELSDGMVLDKSLEAKIVERQGQLEQLKGSLKALEKERELKHEEDTKEVNRVKFEIESKKREMEVREKRFEAMQREIDGVHGKIDSVIEAGEVKEKQIYKCCEDIMNEFYKYSDTIVGHMERITN